MPSSASATMALIVLHYIAPIATGAYYVSARTFAACMLQDSSKNAGKRRRRWPAIALQAGIVATLVAEGISAIAQAVRVSSWYASQDYVIYLVLLLGLHSALTISIAESPCPIWHPYLGAWLVALAFEIPLVVIQATTDFPQNGYTRTRMVFCIARGFVLCMLCLSTSWAVLSDRRQTIKLDDESKALLSANGHTSTNGHYGACNGIKIKDTVSPRDSIFSRRDTNNTSESEDGEETDDVDSDTDDPVGDKLLKEQQKQRLKESGSWLSYLGEFKIFFWILLPRKDRLVQACFVVIGLIMVAERALTILVPRQLGIITNELTDSAGTSQVPWTALGTWMVLATLDSACGLTLVKNIAQMPVRNYGLKALSTTAFKHIMGLSMDFHNDKNSGELIRAIDQGANLQDLIEFFLFDLSPMLIDLVLAFVYVSYLFDIYMALIVVAVGSSYIYLGAKVTSWSIRRRRNYNKTWRNESKVQNEAISNWQTVSHFNRAEYENERYTDTMDSFVTAMWEYLLAYYVGAGAQAAVLIAGRLAAVTFAAYRVAQGSAPVGSFITLITYWGSIETPLANVSYSIRKVSSMLVDSERLLQLLTTKPSVVDSPDAEELNVSGGEVTFDHVDFYYDQRKNTLRNVDFTVKPGQTVALVGETGGGKSTILKLLYRYYDVAAGAIRIDGQDIRDVTLDSLRDSFGMVPQDPSLFNVSIMDNIRYARLDATDEEVMDACRAAAIHDKILSFPDGYKATVGERGVKLSGGELQRVAIARAMLRRPKIVLLDEATSQVDAETEHVIQNAFKQLTFRRTTFVVAHRLSTIQHADLILVINDGQIVERGTHEELFRKKGKYVALWSKQLSKDVRDVEEALNVAKEDQALIELDQSLTEGSSSKVSPSETRQ